MSARAELATRPRVPGTRRTYRKIALGAAFAVLIVAFFALGGQRYLSLDAVKAHRDALLGFTQRALRRALAIAFVTYVAATALSLPGGLVLSLTMGFIFGRWAGTMLVVLRRDDRRDARVSRRALPLRRRRAPPHGRARREDQRRIHRERAQLPPVPAARPVVSVLSRESRPRVHEHPARRRSSSERSSASFPRRSST